MNAQELPVLWMAVPGRLSNNSVSGYRRARCGKRFVRIKKPIVVEDGDKKAQLAHIMVEVNFKIDFKHPALVSKINLLDSIFPAPLTLKRLRETTPGFVDFGTCRKISLALGAGLDNAIALDDYKV